MVSANVSLSEVISTASKNPAQGIDQYGKKMCRRCKRYKVHVQREQASELFRVRFPEVMTLFLQESVKIYQVNNSFDFSN